MKKVKIDKKLVFEKNIIGDLSRIVGGNPPETGPVNTYRCETAGPPCTTDDPSPNPSTCGGGSPTFQDTYSMCGTRPGHAC